MKSVESFSKKDIGMLIKIAFLSEFDDSINQMLTLRKVGLIEEANQKNFIYYQAEVVFLQGSYTAAVYFADNEVTNPVAGADLVAKGTDAGGCVEVYKTAEDAKKRNDYLSAFDGLPTVINPGSHYVYGTVVIRVAASLTASQQNTLTQKIYEKLTQLENDNTSKNTSKTETSSFTKPSSSSSSSTQATISESAQSDTKTVAGSAPTTPTQQQDSGVSDSSQDMGVNPEFHSNIDENGYNSLLGANVLDNSNGGNNSNASTESSSMGSSE